MVVDIFLVVLFRFFRFPFFEVNMEKVTLITFWSDLALIFKLPGVKHLIAS